MPAAVPPFTRLMNGYIVDNAKGCWIWQGHTYSNGYGAIKVFGKMGLCHRLSYELHKGPIPEGMEILHSCDNRLCINPSHLRAGTHNENMSDAVDRNRMRKGDNHPMWGKKNPRPSQAKRVHVLGKEYNSQKEAERAIGLGSGTVRFWVINKPEKSWILEK